MLYGYGKHEFLRSTNNLLGRLNAMGIWNKKTLVVGLDKSVRPLAYAIRTMSKIEGFETPKMMFFNYTAHERIDQNKISEIVEYLKHETDPSRYMIYDSVIVLDDHIQTGNTLLNSRDIIGNYIGINKENIHMAALSKLITGHLIEGEKFVIGDMNRGRTRTVRSMDSGIEDKFEPIGIPKNINLSTSLMSYGGEYKELYGKFLRNRRGLRKDVEDFMTEKRLVGID